MKWLNIRIKTHKKHTQTHTHTHKHNFMLKNIRYDYKLDEAAPLITDPLSNNSSVLSVKTDVIKMAMAR